MNDLHHKYQNPNLIKYEMQYSQTPTNIPKTTNENDVRMVGHIRNTNKLINDK